MALLVPHIYCSYAFNSVVCYVFLMIDGQANFWYYQCCSNDWVDTGCSTDRTHVVEVKHFLTWSSGLLTTLQRANHLGFVIHLIIFYFFLNLEDIVGKFK